MERCDNGGGRKSSSPQGIITVVGTGPGAVDHITPAVMACIAAADVVIGYSTYLDLLADQLAGKRIISSAMMQEVARCNSARSSRPSDRSGRSVEPIYRPFVSTRPCRRR